MVQLILFKHLCWQTRNNKKKPTALETMRSRLSHVLYVDAMPFRTIVNLKGVSDLLE